MKTQKSIDIEGKTGRSSPKLKLLGVTLNEKLNYSEHIGEICTKASKKVNVLVCFKNIILEKAKLTLFKSLILVDLKYCNKVWHFCKASDAQKLEKILERALQVVYNYKKDMYEELLSKAKLPSLANRCLQDILILVYKVKNSIAPQQVCSIFLKQSKQYNLPNSNFAIPSFNSTENRKHNLRY